MIDKEDSQNNQNKADKKDKEKGKETYRIIPQNGMETNESIVLMITSLDA